MMWATGRITTFQLVLCAFVIAVGCKRAATDVGVDSEVDRQTPREGGGNPPIGGQSREQQTLAMIKDFGGRINEYKDANGFMQRKVNLSGTKVTDDQCALLTALDNITALDLSGTAVTANGLKHLALLPYLFDINLTRTKITKSEVDALANMKSLQRLSLDLEMASPENLNALWAKFPKLIIHVPEYIDVKPYKVTVDLMPKGQKRFICYLGGDAHAMTYSKPPPGTRFFWDASRLATTYYAFNGPAGQVARRFVKLPMYNGADFPFDTFTPASIILAGCGGNTIPFGMTGWAWSPSAFGVIKLHNGGTLAAYGVPFGSFDFFEANKAAVEISDSPQGTAPPFRFIRDARERGCAVRIIPGDERESLKTRAPRAYYKALFVELLRTSVDDVNTTLLTQEAVSEMMETIAPGGILCVHVTNKSYNLVPVVVDAANANSLRWRCGVDKGNREGDTQHWASEWVMVARDARDLDFLWDTSTVTWSVPQATGRCLWKDGGTHDLGAIRKSK